MSFLVATAGVSLVYVAAAEASPTVVSPAQAGALSAAAPVKPRAETIPLVTAQRPGGAGPEVREATPRDAFSMLGFVWQGEEADLIEVRTRTERGWSRWRAIGAMDAGPDGGAVPKLSEPVWTGHAVGLQARAVRGGRPAIDELTVVTIDPGTSTNDTKIGLKAFSGVPTMPAVITRAQWGADESLMTWDPEYASTVKAAAIHHTADSNDYTCDQSAAVVRGIYYYHAVTNGWGDIGYNALVDKCGNIFEGRTGGLHLPALGAHTGGFNRYVFGISMIGNYDVVQPSVPTLDAVSTMVAWKLSNSYVDAASTVALTSSGGGTSRYPAGTTVTLPTIFGHRDTGNTACPGQFGYAALGGIRNQVTQLAGDWRGSPIRQKWLSLGGESALGLVSAVETDWPGGGRATDFGGGASTIAWRDDLGARAIVGAIHGNFVQNGGQPLFGYPTTDEYVTPDGIGRYNHFTEDASIYWTPDTGAHNIHGAIRDKWSALGWEAGRLGYPATNQTGTPDGVGRFNHFTKGASVYWTPDTGARAIYGAIRDKWSGLGWEAGRLGYPATDEYGTPDGIGRYNHFTQGGSIYWTPDTGARAIYAAIRDKWSGLGWEAGRLGYPATDESGTPDGVGRFNHFTKGGSVYWTPGTGANAVYGAIRDRWAAMGWEGSWLGYPTSDEYGVSEGRRSDFQGGYIVWNAATGVTTAYPY